MTKIQLIEIKQMKHTGHVPNTFNTFAKHTNTKKHQKFHFLPRYHIFSPCPAISHNTNNTHNQTQILHPKQSPNIKNPNKMSMQTNHTCVHITVGNNIAQNRHFQTIDFATKIISNGLCLRLCR